MKDLNDLRLKQKEDRLDIKEEKVKFNEEKLRVDHVKQFTM